MKLLFTGDINFRNLGILTKEASYDIISEVKPYFDAADFSIVNLETPLADEKKLTPIKKSGANLISDPKNAVLLKALGANVATLANNHIGDFGYGGVMDTLSILAENNIKYCGAGENIDRAYDAVKLEKDGITVSLISVCENEFGMATENTVGSAGYSALRLINAIKREKKHSNYVIIVFHGGNEFNPLPSRDTQDRYRLICDMGADAVIAGHTHCPQGYEVYNGKPIIYSMGNFLFNSSTERPLNNYWYYGYMTQLSLTEDVIDFCIIPYKFEPDVPKIAVFEKENKAKMLEYIDNLSQIIKNPDLLDKFFGGWAYLHKWVPKEPQDYSNMKDYNSSGNYNLICCEAHLAQAKKVLQLCYLDQIDEAKIWADKITELQIMPI